jgi:hypothetical protein
MNAKIIPALPVIFLPLLCGSSASAQAPQQTRPAATPAGSASLAVTPSIVERRCAPGESLTVPYTISNGTEAPFHFVVEVMDVVLREGQRTYVRAAITEGGMAATAIASPAEFDAAPGKDGRASVNLTMPVNSAQRTAVVYFRGKPPAPPSKDQPSLQISLGALVTCRLGDSLSFTADRFRYDPQSETANITVSYELTNTGAELVRPKGTMALLDPSGRLVGKARFEPRGLLPDERGLFKATSPAVLPPGRYRVVSVFEYESVSVTAGGEVSVP